MKFFIGLIFLLAKNVNASSYRFDDDISDYDFSQGFSFGSFDFSDRDLPTEVPSEYYSTIESGFSTLSPTGSPTGAPTGTPTNAPDTENLDRSLPGTTSGANSELEDKCSLKYMGITTGIIVATLSMGAML